MRTGLSLIACTLALSAALVTAQTPASKPASAPKLTIDQLVQIKHPSGHQWTADGRHVWWIYDDGGVNNIWAASADGTGKPVALTNYPDGQTAAGAFWSADSQTLFYPHGGGLFSVSVNGGTARPAWPSAEHATNFTLSPDSTRVAFVVDSDLMVHTLATKSDQRIAHADGRITGANWSADGATLSYTVGGTPGAPIQHPTIRPEIGAKLVFIANEGGRGGIVGGETFTVPATGGAAQAGGGGAAAAAGGGRGRGAGGGGGGRGGGARLDATHSLTTRTSNNGKTRTTESIDSTTGQATLLHEETEEKFFSAVNNTNNAVSPDRKWLLYTADTTGWDQIYVVSTSGGTPTQITKTPGEHWRASWSHDSKRIAWDTNTADKPGDRQIEFATIGDNPATAAITTVTSGTGVVNTAPVWSPNDDRILYQHTDTQNSADLYVAAAAANAKATRLTSSMPATIDHSMFVAPQLVHYPGPDGKQVPAWLFVPKNLDRTKLHPAIVWIHPDGVNMNYNGFHPDRNEGVYYEYHQYLLQQGYVVIAPDYRGSIGYGRDWRNDVYMDVGGNDAKDARLAKTYLNTLGYVDSDRVGVWGLSYGGFFTLLAITQEPTWFRAAVDVAGVADYALYYEDPYHGGWTTSRIGTPEEHPDVYAKAAPMSHVDQIKYPLLILHGTADVNVPFIHSVLLVDHLMKAGKADLVTFMVYPGEFHYFDRSFVVRDAWRRVDQFFGQHLKPGLATVKK